MMKKLISIAIAVILVFVLATGCTKITGPAVIGINQYGEHPSLDIIRNGFLDGLKNSGLTEGTDFIVEYQNAGFDDATATQIAQNFVSKKVSMMVAIATPSATACFAAAEGTRIPVVYGAISDPVSAGLTEGNITGTSDKLPVDAQLDLIRKCQPDAKTIGIIYTTSELNSVSTIKEYKEKAPAYGFTIVDIGITAQSEVTQAADTLITKKVDCISNLTDNTVVGVLSSILEKTNAAKIPVYGSETTQVGLGCVASAGIDYQVLGEKTGAMAAKIIKGQAKASEIPYESITDYQYYINKTALKEMDITLPSEIADKAVTVNNAA